MRYGVVGPISRDRVSWLNGETIYKFGAVAYTTIILAKLLEGTNNQVVCLTHVAWHDEGQVRKLLGHPNISLAGLNTGDKHGTSIELRYLDEHERISCQTEMMTPFSIEELEYVLNCDYIILMPLNETDISLEQLREYRLRSTAKIFLDVHGLITQVDDHGVRSKKSWAYSEEWLKAIDILKMNDKEASWAAGRFLNSFSDYLQYALGVVRRGLVACWITFGDRSSLVAWQRQGRLFWGTVPVTDVGEVVDTIGCGDSASAGFIYSYSRFHSPLIAVVMGNLLGSVKASIRETSEFPTRPAVRGMLFEHYRDYFHDLLDEYLSRKHLIVNEVKGDIADEGIMHVSDGDRYSYGTDDAGSSHRQGTSVPGI